MTEPDETTALRVTLGRRLAERRQAAGYSQTAFAPMTGYARSTVANVEVGRQNVPRDFWQRCDLALGTGAMFVAGYDDLQAAHRRRRDAVARAAQAERRARVRQWQVAVGDRLQDELDEDVKRRTLLIHGLATLGAPALNVDELRRLTAAFDDARRYLDSSVVTYFGDRLAACAMEDGTHGPRASLPTTLGIVAAVERGVRQVRPNVRKELLTVGARSAEFAGWLYRDCGTPALAEYWRDRAMEWAQAAGDSAMQGYVLLKKSQAAWDQRDAIRMFTLTEALQGSTYRMPIRVRAEAAQQHARGHAMLGDSFDQVQRQLDRAHQLLATDVAADGQVSPHYQGALLAMQTAICYCEAGRPVHAVAIYRSHLSKASFSSRDYGYFMTLQGSALAAAKEPDEAAAAGMEAHSIATATNSTRTLRELDRLVRQLDAWATRPAVRELRDAVAG